MSEAEKIDWYHPQATTFGDRVAGAREAAGMSQDDLARRLGVKLKTLKAWEEDLNEPRANKLSMLAGVLNVSLLWLISGEGPSPAEPDAEPETNVSELFAEIREVRGQLSASADRLARLETTMRALVREGAEA